ncbi:tetratricopeptide repeat protein 34 [Ambystoma mexicanum]|uniref:tetratricopeptide repeat protein 34 n=1 Tax=Ambystoma mexicanum TaxID=8296 RepID=UPI0037E74DEA
MSVQELLARLCREGDQHFAKGETPSATAFYLAAFSCNAPVALQKTRSLQDAQWRQVIATLESWCVDDSEIPKIKCDGMAIVSLNTGIAAVFLSTLCPNNFAASMYKISTLLHSGRYEEVVSRCNSLLNAHPQHSLQLLLTRGLSWVLSQTYSSNGVVDYVQAFLRHREDTIAIVSSKHKAYLPQVIQAFHSYITDREKDTSNGCRESIVGDCHDFLSALAPDDIRICKTRAAYLLEKCKYEECVVVYSKAIETLSTEGSLQSDHMSSLLVDRAMAYFCLGTRTKEMLQDLAKSFKISPTQAKRHFEETFSTQDSEKIEEYAKTAMESEFTDYREAVRARPDLRSNTDAELLSPIIQTLQFLIQISPTAMREMSVRLADCQLLAGDFRGSLEICNHLLVSEHKTYFNTLLVLRGFCQLHANNHQGALEDFQQIVEHDSPHPSSCVKALCGRGLVRMLGGSPYLTALDYITACKLKPEETILTIKSYIPWNQRGLLFKVLQEEGQKILQKKPIYSTGSGGMRRKKIAEQNGVSTKEGDASGVHLLASLLMELDPGEEVSRILCTDALYQLDRVEEAHKMLLLALNGNPQRSAVLARLALLQFKKGFIYDGNQLIKKVIQIGDTSCLLPIMDVFKAEDRKLMQSHCHSRAMAILQNKQGDTYVKEAIAYLSFAIIASGGQAGESLLARARCYGHLGQKKTAIFDFNAILKEEPGNVQALIGRAFMYLVFNQEKEAVQDLLLAFKLDATLVIQEICPLKQETQEVMTRWLHEHCRMDLSDLLTANKDPLKEEAYKDLLVIAESLIKIDNKKLSWHILYTDLLIANDRCDEALTHLQQSVDRSVTSEAVTARYGVLHMKRRNVAVAAQDLCALTRKDPKEVEFLVKLLDTKQRQSLSQMAAQEGTALIKENLYEQALNHCSLAVIASHNNPRYLRLRALCLSHLKEYSGALKDLDRTIQRHGSNDLKTQVEDYCSKGYVLLLLSEEEESVKQYIQALQLQQSVAIADISHRPGRTRMAQIFYQVALTNFDQRHYEEAWKITNYGLVIDEHNSELKKLKVKIKREASGCSVH